MFKLNLGFTSLLFYSILTHFYFCFALIYFYSSFAFILLLTFLFDSITLILKKHNAHFKCPLITGKTCFLKPSNQYQFLFLFVLVCFMWNTLNRSCSWTKFVLIFCLVEVKYCLLIKTPVLRVQVVSLSWLYLKIIIHRHLWK